MNILLVSDSFIIREALENLFNSLLNVSTMRIVQSLNVLSSEDFSEVDFAFVDIKEESLEELSIINEAKQIFDNLRVMVLDSSQNKKIFKKVINWGIEGYILSISDKDEFIYTVNKVIEGKKMYAPDLLQNILNESEHNDIDILTIREREVLDLVVEGLNNRSIAEQLYITEYTVKKHVSSIFYKLDLKNRKEVIIYVRDNIIKTA